VVRWEKILKKELIEKKSIKFGETILTFEDVLFLMQ
tara:strand:+ start:400 stop:507 length:108 start_codon:yes stop_codon:yes gene_type:complete